MKCSCEYLWLQEGVCCINKPECVFMVMEEPSQSYLSTLGERRVREALSPPLCVYAVARLHHTFITGITMEFLWDIILSEIPN